MTDRYNALIVVLSHDLRADDYEAVVSAIKQLRNVICVTGNVTDINSFVADQRAILAWKNKFEKMLYRSDG